MKTATYSHHISHHISTISGLSVQHTLLAQKVFYGSNYKNKFTGLNCKSTNSCLHLLMV